MAIGGGGLALRAGWGGLDVASSSLHDFRRDHCNVWADDALSEVIPALTGQPRGPRSREPEVAAGIVGYAAKLREPRFETARAITISTRRRIYVQLTSPLCNWLQLSLSC